MADPIYATLSPQDLMGFSNSVQASDPYGITGNALGQVQFDTRTWDPATQGIASFGKAFLSGLLQNQARSNAASQLNTVVQSLPQLGANPYGMSVPEGVDSQAFNTLRGSAILNKANAEAAGRVESTKNIGEMLKTILGESVKSGSISPEAALTAAGTGKLPTINNENPPKANPNNPLEKKTVELRTDFDKKEQVQNFNYVNRLSNQLDEIMKNPNAVADSSLAKIAVQFIEPKLSVNAGEGAALAQSASIPAEWKGAIRQSLEGGTALDVTVRDGLLDLARAAKVAHGKAYEQTFNLYKDEADRFGIPIERITNVKPLDLTGMDKPVTNTATTGLSAIDAELKKRGYNPDGTKIGAPVKIPNSLFGLD